MLNAIRSLPAYQHLLAQLEARETPGGLGLMRAARLLLLAALHEDLNVPIVLLTSRADHALALLDELGFWLPRSDRRIFPEPNPMFYEQAAWGSNTRRDRIQALTALAVYHLPGATRPDTPPVLIAPVRAVMTRTLPRRDFLKVSRVLRIGQQLPFDALLRNWVEIGYQSVETVLEPGQFSRRGGILDIWPPAEPLPVRLDFFGDELDTLRRFDPATQRTAQKLEQILVTPAREVLPARAVGLDVPQNHELEEFYLPLVHPSPASLLDYLPQNALVLVDDLSLLQAIAGEIEEESVRQREEAVREGLLPASFPIPYLTWSEVQDSLSSRRWLELGHPVEGEPSPLAACFQPEPRFGGKLKPLMDLMSEYCRRPAEQDANHPAGALMVVSRQVSRLRELWGERAHVEDLPCAPQFIEGTLSDGFALRFNGGVQAHLLTDSEIFGWERPQPRQRHRPTVEAPEAVYADLKPGDWVVHIDFGIGRYVGLVHRTLEGSDREFLLLEYDEGDQLFVPVHQADRLSRYIGPDGSAPSLTRLGTADWTQTKDRVREAVEEVAHELLELYAQRQLAQGHAFEPDTPWQQELEASFPYVETQDQLHAIANVKRDMESQRPMDRLLCGDVGYGKTEVALRAAFKAVLGGKQVALLVPTTVLAQQHYETFRQRLAAFPVQVEMLSRFRTAKEQDEIILKLQLGEVDIIIGTHRLLQNDVLFKDLGLVIIDEEQRFGVTHKEHFKRLRTEVDVLTLTATPIPRTLYMALTGARDISTINTPPEERLPIITHIGPYAPRLVRQAVLRELERGGQVFFVHNRVQSIRAMESHLNHLVPEARVGVAHGQMHEGELSAVMQRFTHGEVDVLLCTSIIESGLDIPNANTLIVDRADAFGLAQLYQLRGRVGRSAQRAYAYFFRHRRKAPTPEGQERLEVIAENTRLGAGYSIAMRDLEMRGAGDLLGTRQHGYIATVGFHLYTRMLAQAVRQLRLVSGMPGPTEASSGFKEMRMPVSVELPLSVGIPVDYVPDQNMRLRLYRRLADFLAEADVQALAEEFQDRFGPLPQEIENLLYQITIKLRAEACGLASVSVEGEQIVLRYPPLPEGIPSRGLQTVGTLARTGKNAYWMAMNGDEEGWKARLLELLSAIM